MSDKVSPLAPKAFAELPEIAGVRLATAEAGIKYQGRTDLLLMVFDEPVPVAGVFTQSKCPGAPVTWCQDALENGGGKAKAIVVNSGNANAFNGKRGDQTTSATAEAAAELLDVEPHAIMLASTGVIGEPLDEALITNKVPDLLSGAKAGGDAWRGAAEAIMTTDTYPKLATRTVALDGVDVTINGIAKGSGMIAPDMATMLGFIVTDAVISAPALKSLLSEHTGTTFNAITVDSDTSTSDTVLLAATGTAGNSLIESADDPHAIAFGEALRELMGDLALQIVRDGEGASKLVEVIVEGAETDASARKIALSIANSPLVKTAVAGEDANWGRIIMAVGKAGEPADRDKLTISFGDVVVARDGARDPQYSEEDASAVMKEDEITIRVDLGLGSGTATIWTCDLTKEYVAINGDYRS